MANNSYMSITGTNSGLISAGCSTPESMGHKCQASHADEIMVLSVDHQLFSGHSSSSFGNNAKHQPLVITKYLDKSSPLLAKALDDGEELNCVINLYRTSATATGEEQYFKIELRAARIVQIMFNVPSATSRGEAQPVEVVAIGYREIRWDHVAAGTTAGISWFKSQ